MTKQIIKDQGYTDPQIKKIFMQIKQPNSTKI